MEAETFTTAPVDAGARAQFAAHAEALLSPELTVAGATPRARDIFAALAAMGLPVAGIPPELDAVVPPQDLIASRALDAALSDLGGRPMIIDLDRTLGLSARQVTRVVASFNERYGFNATTWQDTRSRRRLMLGASFMAVAGATTEAVARRVGYGSPSAFCRALATAGLPAPGQVKDALRALE
jgi:AraC-like DNA-binding protein